MSVPIVRAACSKHKEPFPGARVDDPRLVELHRGSHLGRLRGQAGIQSDGDGSSHWRPALQSVDTVSSRLKDCFRPFDGLRHPLPHCHGSRPDSVHLLHPHLPHPHPLPGHLPLYNINRSVFLSGSRQRRGVQVSSSSGSVSAAGSVSCSSASTWPSW